MTARHHTLYDGENIVLVGLDTADIGQWPIPGTNVNFGQTRLPGEALFNVTLALANVVVGSAWRVEETDGTLIDSGTAAASTVNVSVPYYGSDRSVTVKVRKGTAAPKYQPFQTQATITASGASTFVSQVADTIAA